MFEAIIYNIAVTVAGIYLFHRLQYSENKNMVFSKEYVTILMTIVALLLSVKPVPIFNEYVLYLSFVPILFLGRYTNMVYTVLAAFIVSLVNVLIGDYTIITAMILIVIAITVGAIGPFLKQNEIISLQILNLITLVIFVILSLISLYYEFKELLYMIPLSCVLTITSSIIFVDIWHFFSLVIHYVNDESLGLLLIDIDGFKDVNDMYSHDSGDAVLRQIAQLLKNYVPEQFSIYRNGGEEFSVVLYDYTLDQCVKLSESIRKGVEQSTFHLPNKEMIKLSVSIGVGYLTKDDYKSQRTVFKVADDMLHMAKNEGRNQVMFNPIVKL